MTWTVDPADQPAHGSPWRRRTLVVSATAVLPWLLGATVLLGYLAVTDGTVRAVDVVFVLRALVVGPALTAGPVLGATLVLERRGDLRADRWWLAGSVQACIVFGVAVLAGAAVGGGDAAAIGANWSLLSGHLAAGFLVPAFIWSRVAPTYVPIDWLRDDDEPE